MESVVRKCLNVREKCFESNSCPIWLLSILPTRIKSIELINDNDNEQQSKSEINLSPFKLISSIPKFNEDLRLTKNLNCEYPNDFSFENDELNNCYQLICSPSNQQLFYLLNKLKEIPSSKIVDESSKVEKKKCSMQNCLNDLIPLTFFCKTHLLENDFKQILFEKCFHCQQMIIHQDKNNIFHFCYKCK